MDNLNTNSNFVKEVAKYFMNFLETDFKKRRLPKRNTISKTVNGLKVGIDLHKYEILKKKINDFFNDGFKKNVYTINKGEYFNNIPKDLFNLISSKIEALSNDLLDQVFIKFQSELKDKKLLYANEYDKYLEECKDTLKYLFSKDFILQFLNDIDKPLDNLDLADDNGKYQLEVEINDSLFSLFETKITDLLQLYFQDKSNNDIITNLKNIISLDEIKLNLNTFFDNFAINDAFYDIYQIYRNNNSIDKSELYLYFYEISLGNEKFPLFYMPINIEKGDNKFTIEFDQRIYLNTKALDFVIQEFNNNTSQKTTLTGEFDRIIYLIEEDNFYKKIEGIIKTIEGFLELNRNIDLKISSKQKGVNLIAGLSNTSYLFLFDKSDEALINDYEELINDDKGLLEGFDKLLNGFISDNPKSFIEEIDDEWHEKTISNKLIFESPIPLNDEQKQVIMALEKDDCKYLILEGPPGTGKSHTITSIICKALLEEKSVLVLSDKKEALDVVEDKISDTLNKIRKDDNFQNPILRLGKTGNKFNKIVQGQTIAKIKDYYRANKHIQSEQDLARKDNFKILEKNIEENINYFEGINLIEIKYFFNNIDKFKEIDWIDTENIQDIEEFLSLIMQTLDSIKNINGFDLNLFDLSKENILQFKKNIELIKEIEELKKTNKYFISRNDIMYSLLVNNKELETIKNNVNIIESNLEQFSSFSYIQLNARKELNDYFILLGYIGELLKSYEKFSSLGDYKNIFTYLDLNLDISLFITDLDLFINKINQSNEKFIIDKEKLNNKYNILNNLNNKLSKYISKENDYIKYIDNFKVLDYGKIIECNNKLKSYLSDIKNNKQTLFGYLFKKDLLNDINKNIKLIFYSYDIKDIHKKINEIENISCLFDFIIDLINEEEFNQYSFDNIIDIISEFNFAEDKINSKKEEEKNLLIIKNEKLKNRHYKIIENYFIKNILNKINKNGLIELDNISKILYYISNDYKNGDKNKFLIYLKETLTKNNNFVNEKLTNTHDYIKNLMSVINKNSNILLGLKVKDIDTIADFIELKKLIDTYIDNSLKIKFSFDYENYTKDNLIDLKLNNFIEKINNIFIDIEKLFSIKEDFQKLNIFQSKYENFSNKVGFDIKNISLTKIDSVLMNYSYIFIKEYLDYKSIENKINIQFNNEPLDNYFDTMSENQDLITSKMTYFLDKRIIEYSQDNSNDLNTLKNIIKNKQKFPKELFVNLKKAFPCILAGIRDYAEYIPFEKDLFDLIIIDEASQVSISQALPALIRGKKIVILGDDKQFSNVKSNNASTVTNQQFKSRIQNVFIDERLKGEDNNGYLTKIKENFDIKNSILKFTRFIRNYECQLKKHFRCYPEIISYSDKFFYNDTLQCMKIRGKNIEDVIKFDIVNHDGKLDLSKNTNEIEIDFIINKILEFKEKGIVQTLGIISPHREQVTLFYDKINNLLEKDWIFKDCRLKIMTFDTCQGEERDYIFYSMVATNEKDRLNWIFLKDFASQDEEADGNVRGQRLNVGFSRAKECIHFILSKPIEKFSGELKNALVHYKNELENGNKHVGETDKNSPMEEKIRHYFYQTNFYKDNILDIELIPQFPLGDYLKQLDKNYNHPAYKVDFLLIYKKIKIVIEYDGFKEHFTDLEEVNVSNFEYYMKEDDIYRQKTLEGYGYKFLRINRFNIGNNPIETLDNRLHNLIKKKSKIR